MLFSIAPTCTPRPTCLGLLPPLLAVADAPPASVWDSSSENTVDCDL
jgi:hypothetical protein